MERIERIAREDTHEKGSTPMNKLLTEKQVAALLEVSVKTLQGWRYRGCGPRFVKFGRLVRYRMTDLEAFVLEALRTSTSDRGRPPVYSPRPGIIITRTAEKDRVLDRPPTAACMVRMPARPAPGVPTRRRHYSVPIRSRRRIVLFHHPVDGSAPRPAR
jgi:hypothetical protein